MKNYPYFLCFIPNENISVEKFKQYRIQYKKPQPFAVCT